MATTANSFQLRRRRERLVRPEEIGRSRMREAETDDLEKVEKERGSLREKKNLLQAREEQERERRRAFPSIMDNPNKVIIEREELQRGFLSVGF